MGLGRTTSKLLKTVAGKPHATEDDHETSDPLTTAPLPTPPDSARPSRSKRRGEATAPNPIEDEEPHLANKQKEEDEDYLRDPESSDAEDMVSGKGSAAGSSTGFRTSKPNLPKDTSAPGSGPGFRNIDMPSMLDDVTPPVKSSFKAPASFTNAKREVDDAELDEEDDGPIFGREFNSSQPKKRLKTGQNIHASRPAPNVFSKTENQRNDQRRKAREAAQKKKEEEKEKKFRTLDLKVNGETLSAPVFKRHNVSALHGAGTTAGAAEVASHPDRSSSPLSSLSASPEPDGMSIECETCHGRVDKLLKEEYNDDYVKGKSWNIQWQERFCEWHRTQTAKEAWKERNYPDINWMGLERRMRQHDKFLLSVLRNRVKSHYRDEYAAKVKAKSMSNGFKAAEVKPGATVGYYGPKGEKAMSEHILGSLSDEIRERATTDRLVSPSGYQGGISGFVQGVLVPHLAELLIKDDMQLKEHNWESRARELIAESAEVGELVHPEVRDRSHEAEGEEDWALQ